MTPTEDDDLLSIGDVAEQTGVAPDTIRVWERRYGKPEPVRLPSGHRRYTADHVRWLRRVADALAHGYRPGKVVRMDDEDLDELLTPSGATPAEPESLDRLFELSKAYDREGLQVALREEAKSRGPRVFLDECLAPLITRIGRDWADGLLHVRHEHFLSEVLEDTLRTLRLELRPKKAKGPVILLATLAGETHGLGLQMAALVVALAGGTPRLLGVNCPNEEIVEAVNEESVDAVAISISLATGGVKTDRVLAALRDALPPNTKLIVGGRGARGVRRGPRGVAYVNEFAELEAAVAELRG